VPVSNRFPPWRANSPRPGSTPSDCDCNKLLSQLGIAPSDKKGSLAGKELLSGINVEGDELRNQSEHAPYCRAFQFARIWVDGTESAEELVIRKNRQCFHLDAPIS
jgi:hypothetical protein